MLQNQGTDFVKNGARGVVHLIKLIDAADTAIAQYQGTALKHQLLGFRVSHDICCQPDGR